MDEQARVFRWIESLCPLGKQMSVQHWNDGTWHAYISNGPLDDFPQVGIGVDLEHALERAKDNADRLTPVATIPIMDDFLPDRYSTFTPGDPMPSVDMNVAENLAHLTKHSHEGGTH